MFWQNLSERHWQVENFLAPEFVLLNNKVLGEWLNMQLAEKHGVAANIQYVQPSGLFWNLAKCLCGEQIKEETPLLKEEMKWRLFRLLADNTLLEKPCMMPVKHYLEGDECKELKRYQLATSIADLFDQYLIYRPDWILQWQSSRLNFVDDKTEAWQREIWLCLLATSSTNETVMHRAAIEKVMGELFKSGNTEAIQQKLPFRRLFVFGITSMPPGLLTLLQGLGQYVDVQMFVLNPCEEYWGLIESGKKLAKNVSEEEQYFEIGNPLLASQGKQLQEFIQQLQEVADPEFIMVEDQQPQTLLQNIQYEILKLQYKGESARVEYVLEGQPQTIPEQDLPPNQRVPSVHIHQCHSQQREVEVLHDQLRDMFEKMPDLNPRDVVVMMPKVSGYVPYIHAVFNSVKESQRIPYHIIDRTVVEESPLLNSFEVLLKLPDSRMKLSEVLSILEVPAVQNRFGLDHSQFEQVREWLIQSGARWGLDAKQRQTLGLPAYHEYTWEFAINRMMSGYAMAVEDNYAADNLLSLPDAGYDVMPLDLIEGGSSAAFDSFLSFWQRLNDFRKAATQSRSVMAWYNDLMQLLADFYATEDEDELRALASVRVAVFELKKVHDKGWYNGPVSIAVIRDLLKPALQQTATGKHHWQEGIKFCTLLPMRAVPFRVIYMMGMNLEDYPRRIDRKSFDLMRNRHLPGDRSSAMDDRWLFLEALLSARDVFHISYIARDMHRNEKREPSVVLSELMDYIRHGYFNEGDDKSFKQFLFTQHPLQPFSEQYFYADKQGASSRLFSFNEQAYVIANAKRLPVIDSTISYRWEKTAYSETKEFEISLNDFIRFFTKPWDWFFSKKYTLDLDVNDDGVDDEEAYGIGNGLQQWQMWSELVSKVNSQTQGPDAFPELLDEYINVRKARALWPVGMAGEKIRAEYTENKAVDFIYATQGADIHKVPVEYSVKVGLVNLTIKGELPMCIDANGQRTKLWMHNVSKKSADKEIELYIRSAIGRQAHISLTEAECIYRGNERQTLNKEHIAQLDFSGFLKTLVELFVDYQQGGLPFELSFAKKLIELKESADNYQEQLDELIDSVWYGDGYNTHGLVGDLKKRIYFSSQEALRDAQAVSVCTTIAQLLKAFDQAIKPAKAGKGDKQISAEGEA